MKGVFITGTDTGVGKTIISGLLGRYLLDKGYKVITQKWVQTGSSNFSSDVNSHLQLMKRAKKEIKDYLPYVSPYSFRFASSPHLAASLEKRVIRERKVKDSYKFLAKRFDFIIAEGAGGALVPFNKKNLLIDLAKGLDLPVLIVAANKLGAINHTLLTIEAIKRRKMKIIGIIFNNRTNKVNKVILDDNPQIIKAVTGEAVFGSLPWKKEKSDLYKSFIPTGRRILTRLKKAKKNG